MGLLEASLHAGDLADLPTQAHLTDDDGVVPQAPAGGGRYHGEGQRKVGGRFGHLHTPDHRGVDVDGAQVQVGPTLQNCQQEGQAPGVQPLG